MRFSSSSQRRAVFAKIAKKGVSLGPTEIEFRPSTYENIVVTGVKDIDLSPSSEPVPDWVTNPVAKPVKEEVSYSPALEILTSYAKTIKPVDTSVNVEGDKSDVVKQSDDFLAQYAKSLPPEKKLVGAVTVDDEYVDAPTKLFVRNRVRKDLDELLKV